MARTKIKESQVLDSDFASEEEMSEYVAEKITDHENKTTHVPEALSPDNDNQYLKFDGTNYIWSSQLVDDPNDLLPEPAEENMILKSNPDKEWVTVRADDPEEGLKVIALPYYWDEDRQKYLDNTMIRVVFYSNTSNERKKYMKYVPQIKSDKIPFKIYDNESYCIVQAEYATTDENSGKVIDIRDVSGSANTLAVVNLGSAETDHFFINNIDITLNSGVYLAAYIRNTSLDNPVLILGLRKIWEEGN